MKRYSTAAGSGTAEQIIEKSRFIAHVEPVSSKEEADQFIEAVRKNYKDATHNVPAMVIGENCQLQWASDDGEPQGTSGAPIVQMLVQEGITNVAVVVTRYFGGIKLGTGGLVKAYISSAKLGLAAAGICDVMETSVLSCRTDYAVFHKIQNQHFGFDVNITDIGYTDQVEFDINVSPEQVTALKKILTDLSSGGLRVTGERAGFAKVKK